MTEYKYSLPVYRIDDDGDLTFLFRYNTDFIPKRDDIIVNFIQDDDGKFIRRLYFRVKERLYPTLCGDKNIINHVKEGPITLQVSLEVDEPILNLE